MNYIIANWHTILAAVGLLGLAVFQLSQGEFAQAIQNLFAALAVFGMGNVLSQAVSDIVLVKSHLGIIPPEPKKEEVRQ